MKRIIEKGNHRSTIFPRFTLSDTIEGTVEFVGDFNYTIGKQKDSNKLIGLSDNWHHHKDSIRLGWRCNPKELDTIEIVVISYVRGKRNIASLTKVSPNKEYSFYIDIFDSGYVVKFNNVSMLIDRKSKWFGIRAILQPYFGGVEKAPKNFNFKINLI